MNAIPRIRAGAVACLCSLEELGIVAREGVGLLAVGAAASALSQIAMFSLLPLAGHMLAPSPGLAPLPFAALFVGTIVATFFASVLTDTLGRRTALALGASLGIAGGLVVAWALIAASFYPLAVGAFWIGVASGFALQYRHAAAGGDGDPRAIAFVIAAGALVGVTAPLLAGFAESRLAPWFGAGTALVAALAHVFALGAALALPSRRDVPAIPVQVREADIAWPIAVSGLAWAGMMAVMAFGPVGLSLCGIGLAGTTGLVAWHVVAMYAPALLIVPLIRMFRASVVASFGLALIAAGVAGAMVRDPSSIFGALVAVGAGWSIASGAALAALHRSSPSRLAIAAHDVAAAVGGLAGAWVSLALAA
jgi:MFS family permease